MKCAICKTTVIGPAVRLIRRLPCVVRPAFPGASAPPVENIVKYENPSSGNDEFPVYKAPGLELSTLEKYMIQNGISLAFLGIMLYAIVSQNNMRKQFFDNKGKGGANVVDPQLVKETFADVAGLDNAKQELMEVVEFLKDPTRFQKLGARIPKGCLLTGGPGLGKTLLARAVAGEAGVPFIACSASEFVEVFVGVGAARVRELFKKATQIAPCIIFIDEIDAIGKARAAAGGAPANDEREQTINQLLTEIDGFTQTSNVVVLASTNRPDILDKALVRPGRFDRQITLDPPTLKDRLAILTVHTKDKPLDPTVSLHDIAQSTPGLSGAELANITNEAAILAAREGASQITQTHLTDAIDRVTLGPRRQNILITPNKKKIVAVHEAGHAVLAAHFKEDAFDQVSKISIIPRGKSGGVTMLQPQDENVDMALYPRTYLEHQMIVALGGRVAEELCFGEYNVTTGASSDLEAVQAIARAMVISYGFSEKLGPTAWTRASANGITAHMIDKEVSGLVKKAYAKAKNILQSKMNTLMLVARTLVDKEVLTREEFEDLIEESKANRLMLVARTLVEKQDF